MDRRTLNVHLLTRGLLCAVPLLWLAQPSGQSAAPFHGAPTANLGPAVLVTSPDGGLTIELRTDATDALLYRMTVNGLNGGDVIEPSSAGVVVDGQRLGQHSMIGVAESYAIDERYAWTGVHSTARNQCRGERVALTEKVTGVRWSIDLRACNDGAAFRYIVPGDAKASRVPDEATSFRYPAGTTVWSHDLADHYEGRHTRRDIADVMAGTWAAPPFVAKLPGSRGYAAITESAIAGYSGMALQSAGDRRFFARLGHDHPVSYPYRLRYSVADIERLAKPATITGPITTPWRVVMAAPTLNGLVNADIVHNLAPEPDRNLFPDGARTAWAKPGRAVWRYLDGGENTFEGIKQFSALAGQLGFEYQVVEGLWQKWTDAQVRELVQFSRERGVGIIVWKDSRALTDAASQREFLDKIKDLGVAGAKIDFFDHEAKEMIDRYQALLRGAAERHLILDFHGANKPAGEARTWPNELTREGVYGLEHRTAPEWASLNTTLPFTRYLAGAGDYTPVIFGERRKETSWTHQIATAAIFTSPLLVYGANPQSLLDSPAVDLIKSLPSVWDETIVLPPSEIGELAAFARRSGNTWFIAMLNGPAARSVPVDLGFLGNGSCDALLARDVADDPAAIRMERTTLSSTSKLTVDLRAAGGFLGRCSRAAK